MTYPSPGGGDTNETARGSRTKLLAAVGFLLVAVLCLIIVLVTGKGSDQPSAADADAGPATVSPNSPQALDQTIPTSAPPGVSWSFFHGTALPQSAVFGPTRVNGEVATGYAHSPTGALLAAVNIAERYTGAENWRAVLDEQTVPGPGQQAWAAIRAQHPLSYGGGPADTTHLGQYVAFRFVNYTPEVATVQVVTQFVNYNGFQQMTTLTVQWNGKDWLLVLQPDGGASPTASAVTTLDRFIRWGPS